MRKLNSFTLKIMAMIFMLMDHTLTYIGNRGGADIPMWFGYFGKVAAPIFFFLIVEGFFHTKSRMKYMTRLFGFAGLMICIDLALGIHNNIFLSLGFGVLMMTAIEKAKGRREVGHKSDFWIAVAVIAGVAGIFTEASIYGVVMILIFYFLRDKKILMPLVYVVYSILPVIAALSQGPMFLESIMMWDYQWMMGFSIIPILMYNGKQGIHNKFTKWMFYAFYPLHLIAVVLIGRVI